MREQILAAAEKRARVGGYNGFSFRDLAEDVGVKSSSVHYHFPTKADLGAALAHRYTEHAKARLGEPVGLSPEGATARVTLLFRDALLVEDRMCLCGLFGAERDALPPAVEAAVAGFFQMLLAFLGTSVGEGIPAAQLLAQLEGGLILARTLRDPALFDQACGIKLPTA
ncbi:hypothetical protein VZ95_03150 [Elstera litoralis]|uniref:HTH tetR-type domain-containing protein n=1 Tax=Elstera litoralis TaxID=552518 RepID=A0A0F3IVP2_9PROT|nr:TetR/AcrR family transcriptional regulator [Elstera litoralis]KJV10702.1 hypothetical protein VZ95_03150 [Elstera litoralis]